MSQKKFIGPTAGDWLGDIPDDCDGVDLGQLPPLTTLLVRTVNSWYRIVITQGGHGYVQGGAHFLEPTFARIGGPRVGGGGPQEGWVGVGFPLRILTADWCVATSPVCAIGAEPAVGVLVH